MKPSSPSSTARWVRNALILALIGVAYTWSYRVTELDFGRLIADAPKAKTLVGQFLTPDVFTRAYQATTVEAAFPIPCGSAVNATPPASGARLAPSVPCADVQAKFTVEGFDLAPNSDITVRWHFPDDRTLTATHTQTDALGHFSAELEARPIAAAQNGVASRLQVETQTPVGGLLPSQALKDVAQALFVTIFMALFSTTLATLIAAPVSFLAASNVTRRGLFGTGIYYLTRSVLNITRSYDPLVMATVFGFWVGFGPFAGVIALTIVTIASLGKLFSEAVEHIDPGPIEAIEAVGANRLQTVLYAVVPQIIPDFISFIIYHWDINVRISTIIGFVGGGGIGFYLSQRIGDFHYHKAGTAVWAIVAAVWAMDFLSAEVRKRYT